MKPTEMIAAILRASVHTFAGRLAKDPEVKYFETGNAVAKVRMAVNRPGSKKGDNQDPDWFVVEVWGKDEATAFSDTCKKGTRVSVTGRVKTNSWTSRDGEARTDLVITADQWDAPDAPKPAKPAATAACSVASAAASLADATKGEVLDPDDFAEIPF